MKRLAMRGWYKYRNEILRVVYIIIRRLKHHNALASTLSRERETEGERLSGEAARHTIINTPSLAAPPSSLINFVCARARMESRSRRRERERVRARARGRWKIINERSEVVHRLFSTLSLSAWKGESRRGGGRESTWGRGIMRAMHVPGLCLSLPLFLSLSVSRVRTPRPQRNSRCVYARPEQSTLSFFSLARVRPLFYYSISPAVARRGDRVRWAFCF